MTREPSSKSTSTCPDGLTQTLRRRLLNYPIMLANSPIPQREALLNLYAQILILAQESSKLFPRHSCQDGHLDVTYHISIVGIKMRESFVLFPIIMRVDRHFPQAACQLVRQDVLQIFFTPMEEHSWYRVV